ALPICHWPLSDSRVGLSVASEPAGGDRTAQPAPSVRTYQRSSGDSNTSPCPGEQPGAQRSGWSLKALCIAGSRSWAKRRPTVHACPQVTGLGFDQMRARNGPTPPLCQVHLSAHTTATFLRPSNEYKTNLTYQMRQLILGNSVQAAASAAA